MEEILRCWQLLLKALSFQHLEKYFTQVIFLSRAQLKHVRFSFLCSAVSKFISPLCAERSNLEPFQSISLYIPGAFRRKN